VYCFVPLSRRAKRFSSIYLFFYIFIILNKMSEAGSCASNSYSCYLKDKYWQDMKATAEGPLVELIKKTPINIQKLFFTEETVTVVTQYNGLEWEKVSETENAKYDGPPYNNESLKNKINSIVQDDAQVSVTISQEDFIDFGMENINQNTFVRLVNGHIYEAKATVTNTITGPILTVQKLLTFLGICVALLVILMIVVIMIIQPKERVPPAYPYPYFGRYGNP
jgi:hypothetical protein